MTKSRIALLTVLLVLGSILLWKGLQWGNLASENVRLRTALEAETAREKTASASFQPNAEEIERLRAQQQELLRLRGEVSQLRRRINEAELALSKTPRQPRAADPADANSRAPLEHYSANLQTTVPWQHTVVTGGWKLPSGKHGLFFMEPLRIDPAGNVEYNLSVPGQVVMETWIAEIPEEAFTRLGFTSLKSEANDASRQMLLTGTDARSILKALEETSGVDVLHPMRVVTLEGRQAQIKIGPGASPENGPGPGPMIDFTAHTSPDGGAFDLTVSANLWLPSLKPQ